MRILALSLFAVAAVCGIAFAAENPIQPLPFKVQDKMPDAAELLSPSQVKLEGFLADRVEKNSINRLLKAVDEEPILAGFRKRPGSHPWIGEHVGKFLHAGTLAWAYTGNAELKAKLDRVVSELVKCQEPDGYLGTYLPKDRWTSWDVWSHKYNLIGLLTYWQHTGNEPALSACRRMGDLLCNTFGEGKRDIIKSGEHVGMAATSVLEPMVLLYKATGEQKYLDFCRCIVAAYDQPNGPKLVKTLTEVKRVDKTANGKAYEMMSNLVGLCELARVTGDKAYLVPAQNAWEDIVANHVYITGTVSQGEHFHAPHELPNGQNANIGETCATVTWIQLNAQLLRLTGEAKYAEELERTFYNHLAAAQRPDGAQWCYYTSLTGTKPYGPGINCCVSSGPRGMAMIPQLACFKYRSGENDGLAIASGELSEARLQLGGQDVAISSQRGAELAPNGALHAKWTYSFSMKSPATFAFKMYWPSWDETFKLQLGDAQTNAQGKRGGWVEIPARQWKNGDQVNVLYSISPRLIQGDHTNAGFSALMLGPLVLAYDQNANPALPSPAALALVEGADGKPVSLAWVRGEGIVLKAHVRPAADAEPVEAIFRPFADVGDDGGRYQIWMSTTNRPVKMSLLTSGKETRSRQGNLPGSICDGDPDTCVVTFDGKPANDDWFAVSVAAPVTIKRIVYAHGRSFHDGGWFDASAGKPKIQIQRTKDGPWETIGELADYPATTAADNKGIKDGQEFTLALASPVQAIAVRVIGKPACGDNPRQAFSSCAELQAFAN